MLAHLCFTFRFRRIKRTHKHAPDSDIFFYRRGFSSDRASDSLMRDCIVNTKFENVGLKLKRTTRHIIRTVFSLATMVSFCCLSGSADGWASVSAPFLNWFVCTGWIRFFLVVVCADIGATSKCGYWDGADARGPLTNAARPFWPRTALSRCVRCPFEAFFRTIDFTCLLWCISEMAYLPIWTQPIALAYLSSFERLLRNTADIFTKTHYYSESVVLFTSECGISKYTNTITHSPKHMYSCAWNKYFFSETVHHRRIN